MAASFLTRSEELLNSVNLCQFTKHDNILTMSEEKRQLLNQLLSLFPAGSVLPTRWLTGNGYADNLLPKYVAQGWLASVGHGAYVRPGVEPSWAEVVHALQQLLQLPLHVGGLAALDRRGHAHYLRFGGSTVLLYGRRHLPKWATELKLKDRLEWRSDRLFEFPESASESERGLLRFRPEGERHELLFAGEERAFLEYLDEMPTRASVQEGDLVLQAMTGLRPSRVSSLLERCRSYKVKRLFLALAHRHHHAWLKHLDLALVDLGKGKRALTPGGKYDARFQITLPADLDDLG